MNIAIAGYGVEGKASANYWANLGHDITILDTNAELVEVLAEGTKAILGPDAFNNLQIYDGVIRTPSLPPAKLSSAKRIWSATNEFFARCPAPIIGVTGSKGKGTTCSLITSMLRAAGYTVHLVGNIGVAALDVLPKIKSTDIVVYELSSFQLWDLERSPHVALVLYIEPEHQDVHSSVEEYLAAKTNIYTHQTPNDICFYHPSNNYSAQIVAKGQGQAYRYDHRGDAVSTGIAYIEGENFVIDRGEGRISNIPLTTLHLPGLHNQENACAAIDAALVFGVDDAAITKGINDFAGLPHRLKYIRQVSGVTYYDDSIATTPGSAMAAIKAFDEPKVVILGGSAKGSSFDELALVAAQHNVRAVVAIGDEADKVAAAFAMTGIGVKRLGKEITMQEIVAQASAFASSGDIVILSPGCASFDMFKNYADRGDQFIAAVEALQAQ